jgi:hypothetical protein
LTDRFGLEREPTVLPIGEPKSHSAQPLPQGSVFLLEKYNHVVLLSIDPAREGQHQKLQRQSVHQPEFRPAKPGELGPNRSSGTRLST